MSGLRSVLARPRVYELWSQLVGGGHGRSTIVGEYVRPVPGERVLDLGCGPGELLPYLGDVEYVGVDLSEEYIDRARERFGDRAEFRAGDATALDDDLRDFDLVIAFGVLHHLDEAGARGMLLGAAGALRPEGRAVTVDPTFAAGQSRVAHAIIARDRGEYVRTPEAYAALGASAFAHAEPHVRHDLLRMPYSHCIVECSGPSASAPAALRP
jgi:SAM-dependent methyltransferase